MQKPFKIVLLLILAFSCQLSALSSKIYATDKIIAVVNNEVITQKDLNDFLHFMRIQLSRDYSGRELEEKIQSMKLSLLDKLIEDRLILQEATREKIKIDDSRVKAKISEIKKNFTTEQDFENDIAKEGLTQADIEKKIKDQFLTYYTVETKIKSKIRVTPEEVTKFYNENINEFKTPDVRKLKTISFDNGGVAESFSYDLRTGQSVEDLATRYPFKIDDLEVSHEGELRKDIEDVVFKLNIGDSSSPIKVNDKYIIFSLAEIIPSKKLPLSEAQDKIQTFLYNQKSQQEMAKWIDELKAKSYIKITQN